MKAADLRGKTWSQEEVTVAIRENSKHNAVSGKISDEDLSALAEFLSTLAGE
jgi:cytochrome c553